jgi:hypothetical protein
MKLTCSRRYFLASALSVTLPSTASGGFPNKEISEAVIRSQNQPGLIISGKDVAFKGKAFRAIGVNCFGLVGYADPEKYLKPLPDYAIPFIRTNFGEYYPGANAHSGWRLYLRDKEHFWAARDRAVECAERYGLGIIPSLFWRLPTIPDLMYYVYDTRDALDQLGNPNSNTRRFMADVTAEFVQRYKKSPSIWGWEIGNEYSLSTFRKLPSINKADRGLPPNYSENPTDAVGRSDRIPYEALDDLYRAWSDIVVKCDTPYRLRSSGAGLPEPNFYNKLQRQSVSENSYENWMKVPGYNTPAPVLESPRAGFNVVSQHVYQDANIECRYFLDRQHRYDPPALLRLLKTIADDDGRPLFLGEFGSVAGNYGQNGQNGTDGTAAGEKLYFDRLVEAIVRNRIPLSALWNYGPQTSSYTDKNDIVIGGAREYQLLALAEANSRLNR